VKSTSAEDEFPSWEPRELGLPRALVIAIFLVAAITAACVWISTSLGPKSAPASIQAMRVTLAQLPQPAPPAPVVPPQPIPPPPPLPPQPVPPPKPMPAVIPKPPVPSPVPVATRELPPPPPPVPHVYKPVPHPLYRRPPVQPPAAHPAFAPAVPRAAPTAPVVPTRGIPIYGERVYEVIQANQNVPEVLSEMGLSGTAVIEIMVAPSGTILSARVYKSSGVPIIDATALAHARDAKLPPFNNEMPDQPHAFLVPIKIQPAQGD
jgi:periplasmic protein TonB